MATPIGIWLWSPEMRKLWLTLTVLIGMQIVVFLSKRMIRNRVRDVDVRYRLGKGVQLLGYGAMILPVALIYREHLGGLTIALGVAGAGIAFALQEVIASIAGWAAVSFGGFFEVGDRVQLGGIKGDVIDIGILRTTLMELGQWVDGDLYNGRVVRIANSFVFKEPVFNYSGDFPFLWDEIKVPVKYGCDPHYAKATLERLAERIVGPFALQAEEAWRGLVRKYRIEHARTAPMVMLVANDNWMEFTLRYVVDFKRRRGTKDALFMAVMDEVQASEGRLQLASATFQLVEAPPLRVSLSTEHSRGAQA